jgi:serine O-acetyltransferase
VLGPILVGDGAKIGSNAVVVRDVPADSTAVGIPARILVGEEALRREDHAAKLGFSAYAIASDMNDPMVQAIHRLIDHAAETDGRLQDLIGRLKQGGFELGDAEATADGFDPKKLNQMID